MSELIGWFSKSPSEVLVADEGTVSELDAGLGLGDGVAVGEADGLGTGVVVTTG